MRFKIKYLIFFLIIINLTSCTTFRAIKSPGIITGTFKAHLKNTAFEGFFSISKDRSRIDIVNTLGLSVYGIYINKKQAILKNYNTNKIYKNIIVNGENLSSYKKLIVYLTHHFNTLCRNNENADVVILRCKNINGRKIPVSLILISKQNRFRIDITNVK